MIWVRAVPTALPFSNGIIGRPLEGVTPTISVAGRVTEMLADSRTCDADDARVQQRAQPGADARDRERRQRDQACARHADGVVGVDRVDRAGCVDSDRSDMTRDDGRIDHAGRDGVPDPDGDAAALQEAGVAHDAGR